MAGFVLSGAIMVTSPSEDDIHRIAAAIRGYPRATISGADLGNVLRKAVPDINIREAVQMPSGPALTKFVDTFLSHIIRRKGRNPADPDGGDSLYQRLSPTEEGELPELHPPVDGSREYWKAFVRVNDPRVLIFDRESGELSLTSGDSISQSGVVIEKVSPEEFRNIASGFISGLRSKDQSHPLAEKLESTTGYAEFVAALNEAGRQYYVDWSVHRRDRIRKIFDSRLDALGLDPQTRLTLSNLLEKSQVEANDATIRKAQETLFGRPAARPQVQSTILDDDFVRRAMKEAVDRMSIAEIRALPISFGCALDAIQATMVPLNCSVKPLR